MRTWLTYSKPRQLAYVLGIPLSVFLLFTAFAVSSPEITLISRGVDDSQFEYKTHPAVSTIGVRAEKRGNPSINLKDGRLFEESYRGSFAAVYALSSGAARPLSLTRSDFDENAMPDVVTGYASASGGILTLRRGNTDVISSMSIEALDRLRRGKTTENPFLNEISVWTIPADPVFLASGDFNDDGHIDLVTASDGGRELHWFFGTGKGSFSEPSRSEVEGNITMLKAGEFGRNDGLAELVVGITSDSGSVVQIFKSPDGAFQAVPRSIDVPYPVVDIALDDLTGDDLSDLVIISNSNLQIVEAPKSLLKSVAVRTYELPFEPSAVETGNFAAAGFRGEVNYRPQSQIALISGTGDLYLWSKGILSPVVTHFPNAIPGRIQLVRSRVADRFRDGLAILDGKTNQVHIVTQDHFEVAFYTTPGLGDISPLEEQVLPSPLLPPVTLASEGRPIAILSTRYNQDALDDLILLSESTSGPLGAGNDLSVALTRPMANFIVNDAGNDGDGDHADGICDTGSNDNGFTGLCTLYAAINQANTLTQTGITFSVPSITIRSNPSITSSVVIDGRIGTSKRVKLSRDFSNIGGHHDMFRFDGAAAGNSTVKNTEIFGVEIPTAIRFIGSSNNVVQGNYIHDLKTSAISAGPKRSETLGSSSIQIGGLTVVPGTGLGNVLSGNLIEGIRLGNAGGPPAGVGGHIVQGNIIGADQTGDNAQPNKWGISAEANAIKGTVIGGTTESARNIVSGNSSEGIRVISSQNTPAGSGLLIQGNYVGTDRTGLLPIANLVGIKLHGDDHMVGGDAIGAGNLISGNSQQGVLISWSGAAPTMQNNTIQGNLIGLGADGDTAVPNGTVGIEFKDGASFNKILDNTISANGTRGIEIGGAMNRPSMGNEIDNNIIGLNELGTDARPNGSFGIRINNASGTLIGKTDGNIISGNADAGIFVGGVFSTDNIITRNFIGTDIIGVEGFPNMLGILFHVNTSNNLVGGTDPADANLIAYNAEEGIRVISAMGISILGNSIFMNGAEGIDLDADGLSATNDASTPNDPLDADTGPNGLQNFPVISSVKEGSTIVEGTLNSAPNKTYRIEFFSSESEESDGLFEGEKFVGTTDVTTDGSGAASFMETFPGTEANITATATDPDGNTSEFSRENRIVVNSTGDQHDENDTNQDGVIAGEDSDGMCNTGNVIEGSGEPECTLRAAIEEANAIPGEDEIVMDIPTTDPNYEASTGLFYMRSALELPPLTDPVTISRASAGTVISAKAANSSDLPQACPEYIQDGLGQAKYAFHLAIGGQHLDTPVSIINYTEYGVKITSSKNTVSGMCIGTKDGKSSDPIGLAGVFIDGRIKKAEDNLIGGRTPATGNIIPGNDGNGILIEGKLAKKNRVEGNLIGTKILGEGALGNKKSGIEIKDSPENVIGALTAPSQGSLPGGLNIIGGNKEFGILITGGEAKDNIIRGNWIGPFQEDILNEKRGVLITGGASGTIIGGDPPPANSDIRFVNEIYDGISITGTNTIKNKISSHNKIEIPSKWMSKDDFRSPIDLAGNGPTCNQWTGGSGPNNGVSSPRILSLSVSAITGMTQKGWRVDVYKVDAGTELTRYFSRTAEWIAEATANEKGKFEAEFTGELKPGDLVAVTATNDAGSTSELSQLKRPVIVVPGIGGSWIEQDGGTDLWIPGVIRFDGTIMDLLDLLALDVNGDPVIGVRTHVDGMGETYALRDVAYSDWLNGLKAEGYVGDPEVWFDSKRRIGGVGNEDLVGQLDLWRFPNDWRVDQSIIAADLKAQIDWLTDGSNKEIARSCEVDLLSHSNGGVIVSSYLKSTPSTHSQNKVHRSVQMSVPYWGALKGLLAHTIGYVFELEDALKGFQIPHWGRIIAMTRNIPAAYALMPTEEYWRSSKQFGTVKTGGSVTKYLLQDNNGAPLISYDATKKFLTASKSAKPWGLMRNGRLWTTINENVNKKIADWSQWNGPPQIYRMYGTGENGGGTTPLYLDLTPTVQNIPVTGSRREPGEPGPNPPLHFADQPKIHQSYREHLRTIPGAGDETVPTSSATLGRFDGMKDLSGVMESEWIEKFEDYPCGHLGITEDECVKNGVLAVKRIAKIFKSGYSVPPLPKANKSIAIENSNNHPYDIFYIDTSGLVVVDVVDELGNHTGPSGNPSPDNFDRDVPSLGYFMNDFTATVSLPSGSAHTLTIRAEESGSFIRVGRVLGNYQPENLHVLFQDQYVDQNGALQISLLEGGTPESAPFVVDADGDGSFEGMLEPATSFASESPSLSVPYPVPYQIHAAANPADNDPITVSVEFPDRGGPEWSWEATSSSAWITPEQPFGTTPGELQLTLMSNTLAEGSYTDTTEVVLQLGNYRVEVPIVVHLGVFETLSLSSIDLSPVSVTLSPGQTHLFTAYGLDQTSQNFNFNPIWSAQKGVITTDGLYTATGDEGIDIVTVTDETGQVTADATVEVSLAVRVDTQDQALPNAFQLYQSYPNPFNPSTQIPFDVKEAVSVSLKIYDIIGREVRTLVKRRMEPGRYEARFDAYLLPSGIYFYQIEMGAFRDVKKMILLK